MEKKKDEVTFIDSKNEDLLFSQQGGKYPSPIHKVCGLFTNKDLHLTSGRKPKSIAISYIFGRILHFFDQQLRAISFSQMVLGFLLDSLWLSEGALSPQLT